MSNTLKHLANNLKHYRMRLGMTQADLAKKAGINRSYLASLESESQSNTSLRTIEKLADALEVNVVDLLNSHSERANK